MASNVTPIDIPFPAGDPLELQLTLGPCRLRIARGSGGAWVAGRYEDPTGVLPLHVTQEGGRARLAQAPTARGLPTSARPPSLELELGGARPFSLQLEGGANETVADLGGVPLTRLTVRHGAGRIDVDFSTPNPAKMAALDIAAGGVAMDLRNLANANFAQMVVSGGGAQYRLDFGGQLRRAGEVRLNAGVASIELAVPATTAARLRTESVLGGLDVGDGFLTREGSYWNQAAAAGQGPVLDVTVNSVLGAVKVRAT
jgi:hypothetical protein